MSKKPLAKASQPKATAKKAAAAPKGAAGHKPASTSGAQKTGAGETAAVKTPAVKTGVAKNTGAKVGAVKTAAAKPGTAKATPVTQNANAAQPARRPEPQERAQARTMATTKPPAAKKTEGLKPKMAPRSKATEVILPPGYTPSEGEPFMNEMHRAYFRKRLLDWKDDILRQTRETLAILHEDSTQHADLADRATSETDRTTELRTRDRLRKLIAKIDAALARIEDGSYGYCEDTGEPIGLKRLDARPIATLSVEAQERHERREKVYREE